MPDTFDLRLEDEPTQGRFVLRDGTELVGFATYRHDGDGVLVVPHVEIAPHLRGHGLGDRLMALLVERLRADELRIRPSCSFAADYLDRHPDTAELVVT